MGCSLQRFARIGVVVGSTDTLADFLKEIETATGDPVGPFCGEPPRISQGPDEVVASETRIGNAGAVGSG